MPTNWRGHLIVLADYVTRVVPPLNRWVLKHRWWLWVPLNDEVRAAAEAILLNLLVAQDPSVEDVKIAADGHIDVVRTAPPAERLLYLLPDNNEVN